MGSLLPMSLFCLGQWEHCFDIFIKFPLCQLQCQQRWKPKKKQLIIKQKQIFTFYLFCTVRYPLHSWHWIQYNSWLGTPGEHSPHDFLAVRKTAWVPGAVVVIWRVMLKWSTAQAAIFKNTVWKRQQNLKKCDAEILKTSDLSNKIISSSAQSRETIPLTIKPMLNNSRMTIIKKFVTAAVPIVHRPWIKLIEK